METSLNTATAEAAETQRNLLTAEEPRASNHQEDEEERISHDDDTLSPQNLRKAIYLSALSMSLCIVGGVIMVPVLVLIGYRKFSYYYLSYRISDFTLWLSFLYFFTLVLYAWNVARLRSRLRKQIPLVLKFIGDGLIAIYTTAVCWSALYDILLDDGLYCRIPSPYVPEKGVRRCEKFMRWFFPLITATFAVGAILGLLHVFFFILDVKQAYQSQFWRRSLARTYVPAGSWTLEFTVRFLRADPDQGTQRQTNTSQSATTNGQDEQNSS